MTVLATIREALRELNLFQHVSASTLVPVKRFPAVIVEATEPTVTQAEDGDAVLTEIRFEATVLVKFDGNNVSEETYDRAFTEVESFTDSVRTVLYAQNRHVRYSGELVTGVEIDGNKCLMWQFDCTMVYD